MQPKMKAKTAAQLAAAEKRKIRDEAKTKKATDLALQKARAAAEEAEATSDKTHTTDEQCSAMLDWMEIPGNNSIIFGSAGMNATVAHGNKLKKIQGFALMATYVNKKVPDKFWTPLKAQNRWNGYVVSFKAAQVVESKHSTGDGLSEKDINAGIYTIEQKLEGLCFSFDRMQELLGYRQNINPSHTSESVSLTIHTDDLEVSHASYYMCL